jgi:hypothetical protein
MNAKRRVIVLIVGVTMALACRDAQGDGSETRAAGWSSVECGFEIQLPPGWLAAATESDYWVSVEKSCAVGLKPNTWDQMAAESIYIVPEFAIYFEVFGGALTDACEKTFICKDENGTWWIAGRMGTRDRAEIITSSAWRGLRGVSETGRYLREGGYAGPAKAFVALLENGDGRMALIVADNEMENDRVFDDIVRSFRFNPKDG